jgi:transcriptional regulator of heat shock response
MNKKVEQALNTIKVFLGMEVKLEQMKLVDGVTMIQADMFEQGSAVSIVNEEELIPLPIGDYELEDGRMLMVVEEGIISEIKDKEEEVEEVEEVAPPAVEEMETEVKPSTQAVKKTIKSVIEEQHFSEIEELKKEIELLKTENTELKAVTVEEVVEVVELEEVKPIVPNPESQAERVEFKFGRNGFQSMEDKIREKLNNLNK